MGGISGVRAFSRGALARQTLLEMAELQRHRGPDESGVWVGKDVGLAHTRLAMADAEHAHQPVRSVDGRWVVAFDGEIVNHESLRHQLRYPFRTSGDAEVVVAGLALEGISFVERLHGQFALVAHDLRTDTTHLVRDRLGTRPLHYRHIPGGIVFGSEIKALLSVGPPPQVDHRSLDAYLGAGTVPAPDTMFDGVKKVRPAHRVSIRSEAHLEESLYWALPDCDTDGTWSTDDAVEAVGDGVREAVRGALIGDVAVGVHLSGGLDSSLVTAQVQQLGGAAPLHTFSAGFDDQVEDDQLAWARHVSTVLGTEHHEVLLDPHDVEGLWRRLTWHRDAPISDPSDIALFALSRAAHEHVRVMLSGDGGDELFGGHPRHRYARLVEGSTLLPARVRSRVAGPVERRLGAPFAASQRERLLGAPSPPERRPPPTRGADAVDRMLRHDLNHLLPDHLLERGDRMSMAASVELRTPLLDHRLVELALRLPTSVKVRGGATGWVLKEAARPLLPDEVIHRRRRLGPRAPLDAWFASGLRDTVRDRLTGSESWVGHTLDAEMVRDLVDRHEKGRHEDPRLWTLLGLEIWHDSFFGGTSSDVPRPRQRGRAELRG